MEKIAVRAIAGNHPIAEIRTEPEDALQVAMMMEGMFVGPAEVFMSMTYDGCEMPFAILSGKAVRVLYVN
ncbi:MAG: hypothetical protein ABIG63_11505 [Chloroflexota bacterium]